ncbi:flagellar hook-basal body complex protein FliE [Planococcus lenghuensis]|uniref:Flagellar hook-basal body complex protein FliE n=1 Tax=Planococcus lenghuensis TaxID=2213202 RepID=A0A1Q2L183_9BACL|nr:flagellar hook-basal body complex protein FliE [Planococcus lenghuensis]AQQ54134.1 flagellar hook-basal body complex protein FliE [Planococcus lenghuensis]
MNTISSIQVPFLQPQESPKVQTDNKTGEFGELFKQALDKVNSAQKESDKLTTGLVTGQVQDVHEVMIASQKANLSLQLTMQVRNKVVEAYQEMMRMQV